MYKVWHYDARVIFDAVIIYLSDHTGCCTLDLGQYSEDDYDFATSLILRTHET